MNKVNKIKATIIKETEIFRKYSVITEAVIEQVGNTYTREKLVRSDAIAVLVYNSTRDTIVLVRQFRYPTKRDNCEGYIIEVPAGKIDPGETPIQAMLREVLEEVGYKIKMKNVIECMPAYTTAGYSTEKIYYFLAKVTNEDKVTNGGGCDSESENIEVLEVPYLTFRNNMDCFDDLKTRMLCYEAHNKGLFDKKPNKEKKQKINFDDNLKLDFNYEKDK